MYGGQHLKQIDDAIVGVVERALSPFAKALRQLDPIQVDRDTAHLNELSEAGANTPAVMINFFQCVGGSTTGKPFRRLMALREGDSHLGLALAEIVRSVPAEKIPAAMLQVRMRLVAMAGGDPLLYSLCWRGGEK